MAVLEAGPRAALDGVSALQAAGLVHLTDDVLTVVVPKGTRRRRVPGVRVRETRRYRAQAVVAGGVPRTTPAVAAVHAALWAATDRQATYFLTLAVQQGLCRPADPAVAAVHAALWAATDRQATYFLTLAVQQGLCRPAELSDAATTVRRHPRRRLVGQVVLDLADGSRSLGELDVARALRTRGLPEPARQAVRRRDSGTQYLDADFPSYGISLEIDGSQHDLPDQRLADLLRDLGLATEGRTTVRIPLIAWRLDEAAVLDALERLFRSRGWHRPAA